MRFVLNGCDIAFIADAPEDMTIKQFIKQADRIVPDYCACGVRSLDPITEQHLETEIVFDYDDVRKGFEDVCCRIKPKEW